MLPVAYRSLDFLGYPAYRVGADGSVWSKRIRSDRLFTGEVADEIRSLHASGRSIASLTREYGCSNRAILRSLADDREWRRLVDVDGPNGYRAVALRNMDGKGQVSFLVHRLVLMAFAGPCPEGMAARHFPDNNRGNNNLSNLSWSTKDTNEADKEIHGTLTVGERNGMAKLTYQQVQEIRDLHAAGVSRKNIGNQFGITARHVWTLAKRKRWKHDAISEVSGVFEALRGSQDGLDR